MNRVAPACIGVLSLLMAVTGTGCMNGSAQAAHQGLTRHPIHEGRMSTQADDGYQPCGVWRVQGARNVVYLAATSHVVGADQVPFPSPFYAAYQDSQEIYVEMDPTVSALEPRDLGGPTRG